MQMTLPDIPLMLYTLPLIGALIGWFTNHVAVKMLFRPQIERRFLFIKIQGVFPKRQKALAKKLGAVVSTELFSVDDVKENLKRHASSDAMIDVIMGRVEKTISNKLPQIIPMADTIISPVVAMQIRWLFLDDLKKLISDLIDSIGNNLEQTLDVHQVVEEKVASFSTSKMEELILNVMRREFQFIEAIGAVLGFIIGLLQILLLQLG